MNKKTVIVTIKSKFVRNTEIYTGKTSNGDYDEEWEEDPFDDQFWEEKDAPVFLTVVQNTTLEKIRKDIRMRYPDVSPEIFDFIVLE